MTLDEALDVSESIRVLDGRPSNYGEATICYGQNPKIQAIAERSAENFSILRHTAEQNCWYYMGKLAKSSLEGKALAQSNNWEPFIP